MTTAVYYPYTKLRQPDVLKTALLLWDELHFIVPERKFQLQCLTGGKDVEAALEIVGRPLVPTQAQRREAHEAVLELITSPEVPRRLLEADHGGRYLIYPAKFMADTWNALKDAGLARMETFREYEDWMVGTNLGLLMMSILADRCAGKRRQRVTDQEASYSLLGRVLSKARSPLLRTKTYAFGRLATVGLKVVDAERIGLRELVKMRQRNTRGLREMRARFVELVETYANRLTECKTKAEAEEVIREYERELRKNLADLQAELRTRTKISLRYVGIGIAAGLSAVAAAPTFAGAVAPGMAAGGALWKLADEYKDGRSKVLEKYPTSWLYSVSKSDRWLTFT